MKILNNYNNMTYYLSDTILFKKQLQYEIYEPTYATYKVYAFNRGFIGGSPDGSYEDTPFFVGRIFINTTDTDVEIYLNDIIQTRRETQKVIVPFNNTLEAVSYYNTNFNKYKIVVTFDYSALSPMEEEIEVFLGYKYPSLNSNCDMNIPMFDTLSEGIYLPREGFNMANNSSVLLPRIPDNKGFIFGALFYPTLPYIKKNPYNKLVVRDKNNNIIKTFVNQYFNSARLFYKTLLTDTSTVGNDDIYYSLEVTTYGYTGNERIIAEALKEGVNEQDAILFLQNELGVEALAARDMVDNIVQGNPTEIWRGKTEDAENVFTKASRYFECVREQVEDEIKQFVDIAKYDRCPDKYYLMWIDRFGGIQCQPFSGKATYKENFNRLIAKNLYGNRRLLNDKVDGSWELNSLWLNDNEYPLYESLLTSPYVTLFDTETQKYFSVLVTDTDYTEKNYKNTKQMKNFTVNVELNKVQNIIY